MAAVSVHLFYTLPSPPPEAQEPHAHATHGKGKGTQKTVMKNEKKRQEIDESDPYDA